MSQHMLHRDNDADRRVISKPVELAPSDLRFVAGGSPTLPLPPPVALDDPDPAPWARAS
jgi:hypothetical protein